MSNAEGERVGPKKARPAVRCSNCGELLDLVLPECRHCGTPVPEAEPDTKTDKAPRRAAPAWLRVFPVGLVVTLVVYAFTVRAYLGFQYYASPEYQAALRLDKVRELLGRDDGRTAPRESIVRALDLSLEAASLLPDNGWALRRAEITASRLRERGIEVPADLKRRMEFLGARFREAQDNRTFDLPIGGRDLWDVDAVLDAPRVAIKVSLILGFLIALCWGYVYYRRLLERRAAQDKKTAALKEELRHLSSHRRLVKSSARPKSTP